LAEAELEYNSFHESPSVYLGLELSTPASEFMSSIGAETATPSDGGKVKAVIWTTTPWTLPANKAIAFHKAEKYSVLDSRGADGVSYLLVATSMLDQFFFEMNKKYQVVAEFPGKSNMAHKVV